MEYKKVMSALNCIRNTVEENAKKRKGQHYKGGKSNYEDITSNLGGYKYYQSLSLIIRMLLWENSSLCLYRTSISDKLPTRSLSRRLILHAASAEVHVGYGVGWGKMIKATQQFKEIQQ